MARPKPMLDTARLISAAFQQIEEDGLDGLSMRRLATRLGVQAPALYWHVGDKAELLALMVREIYRRAYDAALSQSDWRAWLLDFGRALRAAFAGCRDGARLCASASLPKNREPDVAARANSIAAPLIALGLEQKEALSFQASVISFTLGWASFEANGPMHDYLDEMLNFDESFEAGLAALVKGFTQGPPSP